MNPNQDQKMTKLPLPPEMIVHISKYLNIKDKLNLRLINKSFKFVFDNLIIINCLTVVDIDYFIYSNWFYTNKSNKENDLINFKGINTLNNLFKNDLFTKNIRKLFFLLFSSINLNDTINKLKNLEELNIHYCEVVDSNPILSLPKLKILSIQQYHSEAKIIELETPLLSFLRCEDLKNYQFNYAEKLIYLDSKFMDYCPGNLNIEIERLKNLEYFISYRLRGEKKFKPNLLSKLIHLKEFHFSGTCYKEDLIKLKEIYQYKLKLRLNNLKIFLFGIDYDYLEQLNQPYTKIDELGLILKNYSKTIDILPFIENINFNQLFEFLNCNPDISLDNIARKFPNVNFITGSKLSKENIDCFFEFISKYDSLELLSLTTSIDNKIHYLNKLPNLNQRIRHLSICDFDIDESTNLDFLRKFNGLLELSLGKIEDLDILEYLRNEEIAWTTSCTLIYRKNDYDISFRIDGYIYSDQEEYSNGLDVMLDYFDEMIDKKEENESESD